MVGISITHESFIIHQKKNKLLSQLSKMLFSIFENSSKITFQAILSHLLKIFKASLNMILRNSFEYLAHQISFECDECLANYMDFLECINLALPPCTIHVPGGNMHVTIEAKHGG